MPSLSMHKVLVTGAAGYLASNLTNLLKDMDCQIVRLGRPGTTFLPVEGAAAVEDITGDIRESTTWERALSGVDTVFHLAAQTSAYVANENPDADLEINVLPMLHLLETCRKSDCQPNVLFAGTVTEAGIPQSIPVDETHLDRPITIYDVHKLMAENYLKYYCSQGAVRGATLRLANVYGPGPSSRRDRGVLNQMVRKALKGETLIIYGQGDHLRDYIYVDEVVEAFLLAAKNIEHINGQYFVIGSGHGYTVAEAIKLVAERVSNKTGQEIRIQHQDPQMSLSPIEARDFVADTSRFQRTTGWEPRISLIEGIDRSIDYWLTQECSNW